MLQLALRRPEVLGEERGHALPRAGRWCDVMNCELVVDEPVLSPGYDLSAALATHFLRLPSHGAPLELLQDRYGDVAPVTLNQGTCVARRSADLGTRVR